MSDAKQRRKSKSKHNSPRPHDTDELPTFMQPMRLAARNAKATGDSRLARRPKSEILRELRRLQATFTRLGDDDDDGDSDSDNQNNGEQPAGKPVRTLEQLDALRLTRHRIKQLLSCNNFEQVISNCFVRLNINAGHVPLEYRIAEIVLVQELPEGYYVDKMPTNIVLQLRYEDLVQPHELNDISNMSFTREEFELWRDNCICQGIEWPTTELVARKKIELYNALNSERKSMQSLLQHNGLLTLNVPMRPVPRASLLERFGGTYPWKLQRPSASDDDAAAAAGSGNAAVKLEALNEAQHLNSMMPSGERKSKFD